MPALLEQLIDGPGFVLLPNLIDASEAAQARSRILEVVASPSGTLEVFRVASKCTYRLGHRNSIAVDQS